MCPQLEDELFQWCLQQETDPNLSQILEAARVILESLEVKPNFHPTISWVGKFLSRHPDINYIDEENVIEIINEKVEDLNEDDYIIEELEENIQEESIKDEELIIEEEVSDVDAVNSLTTLIRFSQQRGITELENQLNEWKTLLLNSIDIS